MVVENLLEPLGYEVLCYTHNDANFRGPVGKELAMAFTGDDLHHM